jgi:signal peptidase I
MVRLERGTEQGLPVLMEAPPATEWRPSVPRAPVPIVRVLTAAPAALPMASRAPWLRRFAFDVARGMLLIAVLNLFVLQVSIVRGHSMQPSLHDGDRLVVDRLAYTMTDVARFDVVVLRYPRDPHMDFVKRVVALPGERVAIVDGRVRVNGVALQEDFAHVEDHADMRELLVPKDHYFVLGDNRPVSCDSREFGLVESEMLRGKVRARFWPPARMGTL